MWEMQHHIYPVAVLRPPKDTGLLRSLFYEGVSDFKVSVLLLEGVLVMEEDVAIQKLKASGLAEVPRGTPSPTYPSAEKVLSLM